MAAHQKTPAVSVLIRMKDSMPEDKDASATGRSREDWKKEKELEEARKAGTAPAAVDETGKDINPHIPQYISDAPWYYGSAGPTLRHQRVQDETKKEYSTLEEWYKRGVDTRKIATKYRKGACENCGAITHKRKDCLERPRKVLAKFSGAAIAPDEHFQPNLSLDFDGKRDRWNGYDPTEHLVIVDEFQKVEEGKRILKAEKLKSGIEGDLPDNMVLDEDGPEEDEDKYVDDIDMPGTKMDSKERITVRNLRIREDTAKYLRNLDPNSAYYDPKTRSMRDNPYKKANLGEEDMDFVGENCVRFSGDTTKHAKAQLFAWEAQERGVDVHLLAEPTKFEILKKEFEKKKDEFKGSLTKNIIDKYGGAEHLEAPPKPLLMAQTEDYIEYSRQGKIIKGGERTTIRSKYEEDIYPNNHSSVFGSYWRAGAWGYQCCHALIQNSYCTGEAGRGSNDKSEIPDVSEFRFDSAKSSQPKTLVEIHQQLKLKALQQAERAEKEKSGSGSSSEDDDEDHKTTSKSKSSKNQKNQKKNAKRRERKKQNTNKNKKRDHSSSSSDSSSSSSSDSDSSSSSSEDEAAKKKRELAEALAVEMRRKGEEVDERKRSYNSMYDAKAPTEAELEAFMRTRVREEDPMFQHMAKKQKK